MSALSIGQLAKLANVGIDTIRFYEKTGLMTPVRRPSGFREYSQLDLMQLRFIRRGRSMGLSLQEIGELLALGSMQGPAVSVVQQTLRTIDWKLEELKHWRSSLLDFLERPETCARERASILNHFFNETDDAEALRACSAKISHTVRDIS